MAINTVPRYPSSELYNEVIEAARRLVKRQGAFNLTQLTEEVNRIRREKGVKVEVKMSSISSLMRKLLALGVARREGNYWTITFNSPVEWPLRDIRAGGNSDLGMIKSFLIEMHRNQEEFRREIEEIKEKLQRMESEILIQDQGVSRYP